MKRPSKLSVVLATRNEEANIARCIAGVKNIAHEIVIFDESSSDKTVEIARKMGAKVYDTKHEANFHITKQKAIDKAVGEWILQLDADEVVTEKLADEIRAVIKMDYGEIKNRKKPADYHLFKRHQDLIEQREGMLGKNTGEIVAFFIPRLNMFLGKHLRHAGVYPDGVIRLIKRGKSRLPGKSVHELMEVDGEVDWLFNSLVHYDSPTMQKYLARANRYTDLTANMFKTEKVGTGYQQLLYFSFVKPLLVFFVLYFRHLGILDGMRGFVWSVFSALHFPIAYFKYWQSQKVKI